MVGMGLLERIVREAITEVVARGKTGREDIKVPGNKRACKAELAVYEITASYLEEQISDGEVYLVTEGFPKLGKQDAPTKVCLDPIDGTAYYVRQPAPDQAFTPSLLGHVTIAIAALDGPKYSDIIGSVVGNPYNGEIWSAEKSYPAYSNKYGVCTVGGYEEHDPVIMSDFYFIENAMARINITSLKNPGWRRLECLNTGSTVEMMVKVATGEADAYFNVAGPTGIEMAAAYHIVKGAGGYTMHARIGDEISDEVVKFEERIPVIAAKDKAYARNIFDQIHGK